MEADRTEVVARCDAHICVEGRGEAARQGDGGLGPAFLDVLDFIGGRVGAQCQLSDGHPQCGAAVIDRFAERQGLLHGDLLRVALAGVRLYPPGVAAGYAACLL